MRGGFFTRMVAPLFSFLNFFDLFISVIILRSVEQ